MKGGLLFQRLWAEAASDVSGGEWAATVPPHWVPSQGQCGRWDGRAPSLPEPFSRPLASQPSTNPIQLGGGSARASKGMSLGYPGGPDGVKQKWKAESMREKQWTPSQRWGICCLLLVQKSADARLRERPLGAGGDPGGQPARQWGTQSLD